MQNFFNFKNYTSIFGGKLEDKITGKGANMNFTHTQMHTSERNKLIVFTQLYHFKTQKLALNVMYVEENLFKLKTKPPF